MLLGSEGVPGASSVFAPIAIAVADVNVSSLSVSTVLALSHCTGGKHKIMGMHVLVTVFNHCLLRFVVHSRAVWSHHTHA